MITVDILRPWLLNANQRLHWKAKAERTQCLRNLGHIAARQDPNRPYPYKVRAIIDVLWPDGRRRDADNIRPTIKALFDGMVSAGLLADDDDSHLVGPDLRPVAERCRSPYAVTLRIHFEEA